jgi:tetratricopeptide (TPR) repeat protein
MKKLIYCLLTSLVIGASVSSAYAQTDAKGWYDKALKQSDLKKVIGDLTKALELKPDFVDAWYYRGVAHFHNKEIQLAISDFNKAVTLAPGFPDAYNYRGLALLGQNKLTEAKNDFAKAIQLNAKFAEAYYNRGRVSQMQAKDGKKAAGCTDLKKAKELGYAVPPDELSICEPGKKR